MSSSVRSAFFFSSSSTMRRPDACPTLSPPPSDWPTLFESSVASHFLRSPGGHVDGCAELVDDVLPALATLPAHQPSLFLRRDCGLWTALRPDLSLLTSYCGSSCEASTVRPAASVRSVIFFFTFPGTLCP